MGNIIFNMVRGQRTQRPAPSTEDWALSTHALHPFLLGLCPAGRGADLGKLHQRERARFWGGSGRPGRPEGSFQTDEKSRDELGHDPRWWMFGFLKRNPAALSLSAPARQPRRPRAAAAISIAFVTERRRRLGICPGGGGREGNAWRPAFLIFKNFLKIPLLKIRGGGPSRTWSRNWRIFFGIDTHDHKEIKTRRVSERGLGAEGRAAARSARPAADPRFSFLNILKNSCVWN